MDFSKELGERLRLPDIRRLCVMASGTCNDSVKEALYVCVFNSDDRVSYNALWVFSHFSSADIAWLYEKKDELVDFLLSTLHTGKRRLLLTLLERFPDTGIRADYLDYCLSMINSTEPYAIRALCLKQAYFQCCSCRELLAEFKEVLSMMEDGSMSPGLRSARRNVMLRMNRKCKSTEI